MDNKQVMKRRLQVIDGGRQGTGSGPDIDEPVVRKGRSVSRKVRRRRRLTATLLLLLAAGLITYILVGPVMRTIESRRALSQAEAELAEERSRSEMLNERKERDLTEDYVEEEARKMNYVKPGEIPIIVLDDKENPQEDQTVPETDQQTEEQSSPEDAGP